MLGKVSLHEGLSRGKGVGEGALGTPIPAGVSPEPWTGGPGSCWGSTRVGRRQDSRGSGKGAKAQGPRAAHRPPPQGLSLHQGRGLVPHSYLLTRRCGSSGLHPTEEKPSHPLSYHLHSRQVCCGQSGEGPGGRMRAGPGRRGGARPEGRGPHCSPVLTRVRQNDVHLQGPSWVLQPHFHRFHLHPLSWTTRQMG